MTAADLERVARQRDDALHEELIGFLGRHEDDDLAVAERVAAFVCEDAIADEHRRFHRARRDDERVEHGGAHDDADRERDREADDAEGEDLPDGDFFFVVGWVDAKQIGERCGPCEQHRERDDRDGLRPTDLGAEPRKCEGEREQREHRNREPHDPAQAPAEDEVTNPEWSDERNDDGGDPAQTGHAIPMNMSATCPICGKAAAPRASNIAAPFCSPRCKQVDLGKWLTEGYRIQTDEEPSDGESLAAGNRKEPLS